MCLPSFFFAQLRNLISFISHFGLLFSSRLRLFFFSHSWTALEHRWRCLCSGFFQYPPATPCVRRNSERDPISILSAKSTERKFTRTDVSFCREFCAIVFNHSVTQRCTYLRWVRIGIRSGEVTPNSPSRPHSSMSQQSASSVGSSNVNLRTRTAASRRPRPASIAGTGVSVTEKHSEHDHLTIFLLPPTLSDRQAPEEKKKQKNNSYRSNFSLTEMMKDVRILN